MLTNSIAHSYATSRGIVARLTEAWAAFLVRRKTIKTLEAIDDRLLADIGLTRGDITRLRYEAWTDTGWPDEGRTPNAGFLTRSR